MTLRSYERARTLALTAIVGALIACSGPAGGDDPAEPLGPSGTPSRDPGNPAPAPGTGSGQFGADAGAAKDDGCGGLGSAIFILDRDEVRSGDHATMTRARLRRFEPETATMTTIAPVACPITPANRKHGAYGSLAIDRSGKALVPFMYDNDTGVAGYTGEAFRIDVKDGSCTNTHIPTLKMGPGNRGPFGTGAEFTTEFALGAWAFSSNTKGSADETAFALVIKKDFQDTTLVTLDPAQLTWTAVAPTKSDAWGTNGSYMVTSPQLMGSSDGRLLAMSGGLALLGEQGAATVIEVDRSSGAQSKIADVPSPPNVEHPWLFSPVMWGGDLWVVQPTGVFRYKLSSDKTWEKVWTSTDASDASYAFSILGTTTCAPYAPLH